jgi:hypothetical protein
MVVEPQEVKVLADSGEAILTRVTGYPSYVMGTAPRKLIARAQGLLDDAASERAGDPLSYIQCEGAAVSNYIRSTLGQRAYSFRIAIPNLGGGIVRAGFQEYIEDRLEKISWDRR